MMKKLMGNIKDLIDSNEQVLWEKLVALTYSIIVKVNLFKEKKSF
jgi:hypothetical protein